MNLDRFKFGLISVLILNTASICIKAIFCPNQSNSTALKFEIPHFIELSNSKIQSVAIHENQKTFQSGRKYQYQQNKNKIDIEVLYLTNTSGDIKEYLQVYRSISLVQPPVIRQKAEVGFYGLFKIENRSYLSACINPRGESTFTGTQFARNRNLYDIRADRIILWLFSSTSLRDQRCVWVQVSTANGDREMLEKIWFDIYPTLNYLFSKSAEI
ncbi:MAG: cyanoexosortase A system-associated protein [Plectolyngbya sp. WJT66-NPBG17]|jgi:cyanosortase A-associated protein|nr:cyanoexosortase A system-associated protein [Plectolyngbya sp. WJT66-NPBG17]MBW4527037.1 cyanoexosortase A system-associated protein [Phormidium tanganyikae FI6-MK23]